MNSGSKFSTSSDFSNLVYDDDSLPSHESFDVPPSILSTDTQYYTRVKYIDNNGGESDWSETYTFQTQDVASVPGDSDDNDSDNAGCFIQSILF